MELLLGCGSSREKRMGLGQNQAVDGEWTELVTCDVVASHEPDVVWDLNVKPWPWPDDTFDEVHAYEVLEHLGNGPGDHESFFADFSEIHRVLKPDGHLLATCPSPGSPWVWGDPSHRRAIFPESLIFLSQAQYEQVGQSPMSDFRGIYKADFEAVWMDVRDGAFLFVLKAVKP